MDDNKQELETLCRQIVRELTRRHQWQLLAEDEFVSKLREQVQREGISTEKQRLPATESVLKKLTNIAINIYCQVWYGACAGEAGTSILERGYGELVRYLYNAAITRWHVDTEVARVIAQNTTGEVFRKIHTCRERGYFIAFFVGLLRNEFKKWVSSHGKEIDMPELAGDDEENDESLLAKIQDRARSPEENAMDNDVAERVVRRFIDICEKERKAARQLAVVAATYLLDLTDEEIAEMLETTSPRIHVLRSRGLKLLRTKYSHDFYKLWGIE